MAVITISRQFGSGGRQVAARVCELLGYSYLDKLLMTQVAAEVGLSGKELADYSEERRTVRNLLESESLGMAEKIYKLILNEGRDTIVPFHEFDPKRFEKALLNPPKVIFKF